ncbi:histone H1-delta-like [Penaeus indicus]|uniref:histone H1-delta-like n=1 Tax=Penaeus indicus TaxID=29960 RepID=UPI00300CCD8D
MCVRLHIREPGKLVPQRPHFMFNRPSAKRAHPKYSEMVAAALRALKERNGSSRQAILKFILASFQVGDEKAAGVIQMQALRSVAGWSLQQTKGAGASGSLRLFKELKMAAPRKNSDKKNVTKNEKTPRKAAAKKTSDKTVKKETQL